MLEYAVSGVEAGRAGGFGFVVGVERGGQADDPRAHGAARVADALAEPAQDACESRRVTESTRGPGRRPGRGQYMVQGSSHFGVIPMM